MADGLDDQRREVLDLLLMDAAFDGWTKTVLTRAVMEGLDAPKGHADILFPGGIVDALDFWSREMDTATGKAWRGLNDRPQRIRDKVTWLVRHRIEALTDHREAARRAAATLALPIHGGAGLAQAWRTADGIWMALGDTSTDGNYYSKRTLLSGVFLSTLARWFADAGDGDPEPYGATWDFLDKRIDGVMQIEKVKAQVAKVTPDLERLTGALARLRYGRDGA